MRIDTTPCTCGSGLRRLRCCGLDLRLVSPAPANGLLATALSQAREERQKGHADGAAKLCRDILELSPGWIEALVALATILHGEQPRVAEVLLSRVVTLDPNHFSSTLDLARLLLVRGALVEAERYARQAIRLEPESPQAHNLLGLALTRSNRPRTGEYHFRRVLALAGSNDPVLLSNLGWSLKEQGRTEEARSWFEASLKLAPNNMNALLNAARLEEVDRKFSAAEAFLDRAEKVEPENSGLMLTRAVCAARTNRSEEALRLLDRLGTSSGKGALDPYELSEKGRILDRMGRHDEAWIAFEQAKQHLRDNGGQTYQDDQAAELIQRLKGFFTARRLSTFPRARTATGPRPIFIVGFPRSGTTLLEQSLSTHPGIAAGDELPFIHEITRSLPRLLDSQLTYPEALAELWMGDHRGALDRLRDIYLAQAIDQDIVSADGLWFTDKMPLNETHLGLIAMLFPESPIIHLIRHPLDVVVSVFSNHLSHGFNCAAALDSIARHFLRIADLVAHYRAEMMLRYLPLRYEDLVTDQEASLRRVFDFIGLAFDPRSLASHENQRYARTASYAQVTEPVYDRSVYRHRDYLKQLEPVIPILEPVIQRLGYEITEKTESREK